MKLLDKGGDKVERICDMLRRETLEPAQAEAKRLIEEAREERERLLRETEAEIKQMVARGRAQIEQEKALFRSSLSGAAKQTLDLLKGEIETALFNPALNRLIEEKTADPKLIAKLIDVLIKAIEREGISVDFSAIVSKSVSSEEVNRLLLQDILKRLKGHSVQVGHFAGGAQIKLHDKKMTLDISSEALVQLLAGFLREDFRSHLFLT